MNKWISECLDPGEYPQLAEADLPTLAPPVFTSAIRDHRKTILRESGDTVRSVKSSINLSWMDCKYSFKVTCQIHNSTSKSFLWSRINVLTRKTFEIKNLSSWKTTISFTILIRQRLKGFWIVIPLFCHLKLQQKSTVPF